MELTVSRGRLRAEVFWGFERSSRRVVHRRRGACHAGADHPAKDLKQFVEWAKANPGKANCASGGLGASTHLNGELLNSVAGLDLLHVPYKGSAPAVTDLIGGQTHLLIDAGTVLLPQIKGGRLKALAVSQGAPFRTRWRPTQEGLAGAAKPRLAWPVRAVSKWRRKSFGLESARVLARFVN